MHAQPRAQKSGQRVIKRRGGEERQYSSSSLPSTSHGRCCQVPSCLNQRTRNGHQVVPLASVQTAGPHGGWLRSRRASPPGVNAGEDRHVCLVLFPMALSHLSWTAWLNDRYSQNYGHYTPSTRVDKWTLYAGVHGHRFGPTSIDRVPGIPHPDRQAIPAWWRVKSLAQDVGRFV